MIPLTHPLPSPSQAIAAWGRTDELGDGGRRGWDASDGNIPEGTRIEGNLIRETGIWEKQSSCFFQAKTAATTLSRNLCFNLPRAGFNFNDGLGGTSDCRRPSAAPASTVPH